MNTLLQKLKLKEFFDFMTDCSEWKIFLKRFATVVAVAIFGFVLWIFPVSIIVAPFYSLTSSDIKTIKAYDSPTGKSTVKAVEQTISDLLDEGLVTNFTGVNFWIDNKYYEQVGQIEMLRISVNSLENHLARNRGTGGANKHLVQARSDVYADYTLPAFTSYSTRLQQARKNITLYLQQLQKDSTKQMNQKKAVFIVNSDNLAQTLDKIKQQLQTNIMLQSTFASHDDKFYRLKGNLIAMYTFLKGIQSDFEDKMKDKSTYMENFKPLLEQIEQALKQNHLVILETFGHVSKLEKEVNIIAQKLGELRDKLQNG